VGKTGHSDWQPLHRLQREHRLSGWGLVQINSTFQGLFGKCTFFGSGPISLNGWTHVAIVRAGGTTTLYVNGLASGTTTSTPNVPAGSFGVAAPPQATSQERWSGRLDEVRVFTFAQANSAQTTCCSMRRSPPPTVVTQSASGITVNGATLTATVNPSGPDVARAISIRHDDRLWKHCHHQRPSTDNQHFRLALHWRI